MKTTEFIPKRKGLLGRLTSLVILVGFVFIILLVSFAVAGAVVLSLIRAGLMPTVTNNNLLILLVLMLFVSLGVGTVLAVFGGTFMMKPLRELIDATKRVSAGDFDVRVEPHGTFEMQRLMQSFNDMATELGSLETLRNDFVRNISHEFKTPVASIRGFAKLLKKKTLPEEKRDEYLDIIIHESSRMAQLSGNVLLLSKLDSTDRLPDTAEYALDEQLRRAVLVMEPAISQKDIEVTVDLAPVTLNANEEMLQHVWLNLLGNAVKFTPPGGQITVALQARDGAARVTISDNGIGMDEATKAHIFDKFYQGDDSRATAGNGLGLSLSQRIISLSGGNITVESAPGEGSAFTVELPCPPAGPE
ncbi:HAMP domain-containing histidine kinase [Ruminococcaceae bacterium OttesenSCG-928-D13]|nr:HAMP domain-containing histidine kinase [Ruminococcaceae bacterium OttesenSCG-928-D13]